MSGISSIIVPNNYVIYAKDMYATIGTFEIVNAEAIVAETIDADVITANTFVGTFTGSSTSTQALETTGASVNVDLSAPPSTGQVLVATSATTSTWQTLPAEETWQAGADLVDKVRIGATSVAASANQVALLGSATGTLATAVGSSSTASGTNSTAVGKSASAGASFTVALGDTANASTAGSIACGRNSVASGTTNASAFGSTAIASGLSSTSIGFTSTASATNSVALGTQSQATGLSSVACGASAVASGNNGVALGTGSICAHAGGVNIGANSTSTGVSSNSVAIGTNSTCAIGNTVAIGLNSKALVLDSVSIGNDVSSTPTILGTQVTTNGHKTITNKVTTTTAALTNLVTYRMVNTGQTATGEFHISAYEPATGDYKFWFSTAPYLAAIKLAAATLVGSPGTLGSNTASAGAAAWAATPIFNAAGYIVVNCTGEVGKTINWSAAMDLFTIDHTV